MSSGRRSAAGFGGTGKGWWALNEQLTGEVAWKPAHQLGDYSVGRGNGKWRMVGEGLADRLAGDAARAYMMRKPEDDEGEDEGESTELPYRGYRPSALEAPEDRTSTTLSATAPTAEMTRLGSFDAGYRLTNVASQPREEMDPYDMQSRFNFPTVQLPEPVTPSLGVGQPALGPRRAAFSQGAGQDIEEADVVGPGEIFGLPRPLALGAGPKPRRKAGINPAAMGRIRDDLSQFRV